MAMTWPRLACLVLLLVCAGLSGAADPSPVSETFLRFAWSVAELQARSAELAARRQARPQVQELAASVREFRRAHLNQLTSAADESGVKLPAGLQFEHAVIFENLQPLDFLAFSRRWADLQVQALQQEIAAYERYAAQPQAGAPIVAFVQKALPELQAQLRRALEVQAAAYS